MIDVHVIQSIELHQLVSELREEPDAATKSFKWTFNRLTRKQKDRVEQGQIARLNLPREISTLM